MTGEDFDETTPIESPSGSEASATDKSAARLSSEEMTVGSLDASQLQGAERPKLTLADIERIADDRLKEKHAKEDERIRKRRERIAAYRNSRSGSRTDRMRQTYEYNSMSRADVTEDWLDICARLRKLLEQMEEQPDRYTQAECIVVLSAIATIGDPEIPSEKKAREAKEVGKLFGSMRARLKKDDPGQQDPDMIDKQVRETAASSTKDLLAIVQKGAEPAAPEVKADG